MSLIQERIQDVYKQSANVEGRKYQGAKITQCTVSSIILWGKSNNWKFVKSDNVQRNKHILYSIFGLLSEKFNETIRTC